MRRYPVAAALTIVTLTAVAVYAAVAANTVALVGATSGAAVLGAPVQARQAPLRGIDDRQVRIALAASPLSPRLVNIAMVRAVAAGAPPARWMAQLAQLGWRDTPTLQNRLYAAALARNVAAIVDLCDALLRRRSLVDQIIPALSVVETDPNLSGAFVDRLARWPNWRGEYLTTTGQLRQPSQLAARYRILRALRGRGPLGPGEAVQNVRALDAGGLPDLAFALWRAVEPEVTSPLDDAHFVRASRDFQGAADTVPYQWQMLSGEGYSAGASTDAGRSTLDIDWDGRGVPIFAQQRTSASPGSYMLAVRVASSDLTELAAFSFRLMCGNDTVELRQDPRMPDRLLTTRPVSCGYPTLQIAGDIQPSATPHRLAFEAIELRRVGETAAGRP